MSQSLASSRETSARSVPYQFYQTLTTDTGAVSFYSGLVAGVVAVVSLLVVGVGVGAPLSSVAGVVSGLLFAVSVAAIGAKTLHWSILRGLALLGTLGLAGGLPVWYLLGGNQGAGGLAVAGVLVGVGLARFRLDTLGEGAVARAVAWLLQAGVVLGLAGLVAVVVGVDFSYFTSVGGGIGELLVPTTETGVVLGFVVVAWLAYGGIWSVAAVLPPDTILPPSRRPQYHAIKSRTVSTAGLLFGVGGIIAAMIYLVSTEAGLATATIQPTVGVIVESQLLRETLLRVFIGGMLLAVLLVVGRSVGATAALSPVSWSRPGVALAGGLLAVAYGGAAPAVEAVGSLGVVPSGFETTVALVGPTATGVLGGVVGLVGVGVGLSSLSLLSGVGLLPASTAGPRMAVGGLVVAAIVAATTGASWVVFAAAVAAVVVWDVAAYGVGLTADLGAGPGHREGELIHAAASLCVGVVGFVVAVGVQWLIAGVTVNDEGLVVTVVLAVVAAAVVSLLLRG